MQTALAALKLNAASLAGEPLNGQSLQAGQSLDGCARAAASPSVKKENIRPLSYFQGPQFSFFLSRFFSLSSFKGGVGVGFLSSLPFRFRLWFSKHFRCRQENTSTTIQEKKAPLDCLAR